MGDYHIFCVCNSIYKNNSQTASHLTAKSARLLKIMQLPETSFLELYFPNVLQAEGSPHTYCCGRVCILDVWSVEEHVCCDGHVCMSTLLLNDEHRQDGTEVIVTPLIFHESNISQKISEDRYHIKISHTPPF